MFELIASIPVLGGFLATVIPFVIVLGVVVFIHEYGHYIVGRWCGIHADVFSVGYGKPIYTWKDKRGTLWQIAMLPLGGYVKFRGDENAASFNRSDADAAPGSFPAASVGRRALTVAAGPVFNFILSAIVFAALVLWQGQAVEQPTVGEVRVPVASPYDLRTGDQIRAINGATIENYADIYTVLGELETPGDLTLLIQRGEDEREILSPYLLPPLVAGVTPLSPASDAGITGGDLILSVGEAKLTSFEDLRQIVLASEGQTLDITVLRDGQEIALAITPQVTDTPKEGGGFEKRVMIGVVGALAFDPMTETPSPLTAIGIGVERVGDVIVTSLDGLKHIIRGAFGAEDGLSADQLQGPLGIAQISGESARHGFENFIRLIALLSTAIGMLNLFPIPILDGGHLMIFLYEAITGKQPHEKVLNIAMSVGFVLLMALMIFATYNDIERILIG